MKRSRFFAGLCSAALAASIIPVSAEESKTAFCEAVPDNVSIPYRTVYNDESPWSANTVGYDIGLPMKGPAAGDLSEITAQAQEGHSLGYRLMPAAENEPGTFIADITDQISDDVSDDGTLDDLESGEYEAQPAEADTDTGESSDVQSDVSYRSTSSSVSVSDSTSGSSTAPFTNQSEENPTTGMAGGMAMIALMGGAVIVSKRKK